MAKRKETPKQVDKTKKTSKAPTKPAPSQEQRNKKAAVEAVKDIADVPKPKKPKNNHPLLKSIIPYALMLLALILFICFFTVHMLQLEDGAGIVGYYIQWVLCGLLGGAAFLIPFALFFIGIKWCLYNIKAKDTPKSEEASLELMKTKKRNLLQTVMAGVAILLISALLGVFSPAQISLLMRLL